MTNLVLIPVKDQLPNPLTIYDPACGGGGIQTESQDFVTDPEGEIKTKVGVFLYGKEAPENIRFGSTLRLVLKRLLRPRTIFAVGAWTANSLTCVLRRAWLSCRHGALAFAPCQASQGCLRRVGQMPSPVWWFVIVTTIVCGVRVPSRLHHRLCPRLVHCHVWHCLKIRRAENALVSLGEDLKPTCSYPQFLWITTCG
nr:SAM-dependent methyltransferase [Aquabacterium sp. CECT 9606]